MTDEKFPRPKPLPVPLGETTLNLARVIKEYKLPKSLPGIKVMAVDKGREAYQHSEDACAISSDGNVIALADGVSTSHIPHSWAAVLSLNWIRHPFNPTTEGSKERWLNEARSQWRQYVEQDWIPRANKANANPLPESEVRELLQDRGASATFLGVEILPKHHQIRAVAQGDTCLFLVHNDIDAIEPFPLFDPEQFSDRTYQFRSVPRTGLIERQPDQKNFSYHDGDTLALATDEVAKWIMQRINSDRMGIQRVMSLTPEQFPRFIQEENLNRRMGTDDCSLLVISLGNQAAGKIKPIARPVPVPIKF